jgi:hypothetical protein
MVLNNSAARRKARANLMSKNDYLIRMFYYRNVANKPAIIKYVRTKWPSELLPRFNKMLMNKLVVAAHNANVHSIYKEMQARRKANNNAKKVKARANENARVRRLQGTNNGRKQLAHEKALANNRERKATMRNQLAHGGHFLGPP